MIAQATSEPHRIEIPTARVFRPLLDPAPYKGAYGGRGSGKSHFFAEHLVERCVMQPGLRAVCIREVQKSLEQSAKRTIEDKIDVHGLGGYFRCMQSVIKTPGDGTIIFQGMQDHTADSIKSLEGFDIAWVEEGQSLSKRSIDLLLPTIRKDGSEVWVSWNPVDESDPVDSMFRGDAPPPGAVVVEANWQDNPWFPQRLKELKDYAYRTDPDSAAHIWEGKYWSRSDAQVLNGKWTVDEFSPGEDWDGPYYGGDWGFSQDPTTLVRFWITPDDSLAVEHEVYGIGIDLDETPEMFDGVPGAREHVISADSARPETIRHMTTKGFKVRAAEKWSGSVEDGIAWLRGRPKIIIHPRCKHAAEEARLWRYKSDKAGNPLPKLVPGSDHIWDAVRYGASRLIKSKKETPAALAIPTASHTSYWRGS